MLPAENETAYIRRELAARILKLYFNDELLEKIDALPVEFFPKGHKQFRCCIYKDRAMIRYRIMALLGISIEQDDDDTKPLTYFAQKALDRLVVENPILTVIDMACNSCPKSHYRVTEFCAGCVARPCKSVCPVGAVSMVNGKSHIDREKCISCGKCKDVCPYSAISYIPIPCEAKCPVGALTRNPETDREEIDYSKCIYCGRCTRTCPFGAVMERSQLLDVAQQLKSGKKVVAMVAPSIAGQFPGSMKNIVGALLDVGFSSVYEVAYGADITARNEAIEFAEKMQEGVKLLGTSCCPAYVESVNKHAPDFKPFVSHTLTPMAYTAIYAKEKEEDAIRVFIGPCIAKKFEGLSDENVDFVLTYDELASFFLAKEVDVASCSEMAFVTPVSSSSARMFAVANGVANAVLHWLEIENLNDVKCDPLVIDGLDKKGLTMLKMAAKGKVKNNLIEVMSCEGGCQCGPGVVCSPKISRKMLEKYSASENL